MRAIVILLILATAGACAARAQGNYEIQVYGSETVAPRTTMVEVHSNFTAEGQRETIDGVVPTYHAQHETLEITQGLNEWSELGFYVFTTIQSQLGWEWVGDHIRPRVRVPPEWHWPVGASLSMEIGYQRGLFSQDTWTWEIRPIVDKQKGRFYWAVNPAFERTLHGPDVNLGLDFSPAVKVSWDFTKVVTGGFEYYADYGSIRDIYPVALAAAADLSGHRPERFTQVGDQLRGGRGRDRGHRSLDREVDHWKTVRLGQVEEAPRP